MLNNYNNTYNSIPASNVTLKRNISHSEDNTSLTMRKITHEFGNALTLINSSLQIIESSHPEVKGFKYWSSTIKDVNYLINLVAEVSSYNNERQLHLVETNVISILETIIDTYSGLDNTGYIDIRINTINDVPTILADHIKIKQVFINLIKNSLEALDSTRPSYINIYLERSNHYLVVKIEDNGCGIPSKDINDIFTPMVTFKSYGTGLGLPISKKIIEAHNGTIEVISTEGIGTTFTITLPC